MTYRYERHTFRAPSSTLGPNLTDLIRRHKRELWLDLTGKSKTMYENGLVIRYLEVSQRVDVTLVDAAS